MLQDNLFLKIINRAHVRTHEKFIRSLEHCSHLLFIKGIEFSIENSAVNALYGLMHQQTEKSLYRA